MSGRTARWTGVAATALIALGVGACGGDGNGVELSDAGRAGRSLANGNGCASCHGQNGQGGVGPQWTGLYGAEIELADGSTVVADREYLVESILEPDAKIHAGYTSVKMPGNGLSEEQAQSIVDYIEELAAEE